MASDLLVVLALLIFIAAAISAFVFIPFHLSLFIEHQEAATLASVVASWFVFSCAIHYHDDGGSLDLLIGGKRVLRKPFAPLIRPAVPAGERNGGTAGDFVREILILREDLFRIARALFRHTRFRSLTCDLRFGLSSPAVTGMVFGWYAAIRPFFMQMNEVSLSATPVFDRRLLEGQCRCNLIIVRPLVIPVLVIRMFLRKRTWNVVSMVRHERQGVAV